MFEIDIIKKGIDTFKCIAQFYFKSNLYYLCENNKILYMENNEYIELKDKQTLKDINRMINFKSDDNIG
jgi:hypothetical protein